MKQMDLFGGKPAKYPNAPGHRGVPTSVAAAEAIKPAMSRQQRAILEYLATRPDGAIYTDINAATGIAIPSICGRLHELVEDKRVAVVKGQTRQTPSGRKARVYKAV